jgi:hypothetical protein
MRHNNRKNKKSNQIILVKKDKLIDDIHLSLGFPSRTTQLSFILINNRSNKIKIRGLGMGFYG